MAFDIAILFLETAIWISLGAAGMAGVFGPQRALLGFLLVIFLVQKILLRLSQIRAKSLVVKYQSLALFCEFLTSRKALTRYYACYSISAIVGNRFGLHSIKSATLWDAWCRKTDGHLSWDAELERAVEVVEVADSKQHETGTRQVD